MARNYTAPRPDGWGAMDVSAVRLREPSGSTSRPDDSNALHRARRWECAGPDGDGRAARARRAAERDDPGRRRVDAPRSRVRSRARATSATSTSSRSGFRSWACSRMRGWNTHQFHAPTEFYADFGVYDVRITVPTPFVVGATGRQTARTDNSDGSTTHRYHGEDVHDFAWTASPDYVDRVADVHAPDAAARRDAPAASAGAPRTGRPLLRRHGSGVEAIRRVVRRVSVRPRDDRRSGLPEPGRRHGVPDVLHRPRPLAAVSHAPDARDDGGP